MALGLMDNLSNDHPALPSRTRRTGLRLNSLVGINSRSINRVALAKLAKRSVFPALAVWLLLTACTTTRLTAADWATYLGDNNRSGATTDSLTLPLTKQWTYHSPAAPEAAWAGPNDRHFEGKLLKQRIAFDDAIHVAVVGDRVYFGSSVDHQLHCCDIKTGKQIWNYFTGGPIRLAPTVFENRVYFGSDDGNVYCLNATDGTKVWQLRAGPEEEWLVARGSMISRWPVRTGVLIDEGIAYFGAGIFPHENVYLYAVNAADGSLVWKLDNISQEDAARNDLSPQGYLLANADTLFIPSGRSLPAAIDRKTGEMLHKRIHSWRTTAGGVVGGTQALLADGQIYTWGDHHILALNEKDGNVGFGWFEGDQLVVTGKFAYMSNGDTIAKLDRLEYAVASRKRHDLEMEIYSLSRKLRGLKGDKADAAKKRISAAQSEIKETLKTGILWSQPSDAESALIAAGDLVIAGGNGYAVAFDGDSGEQVWKVEIDGDVRGLAAANGNLFVSNTAGQIIAFSGATATASPNDETPTTADVKKSPYPQDDFTAMYEQAAEQILKTSQVKQGFCLVLGSENGRLAYELAKRSSLEVYGLEPNAEKVAESRRLLSSVGLYGNRITIHHAELSPVPYSSYFANLIVSDSLLLTGKVPGRPNEVYRHLKPLGGVAILGTPAESPGPQISLADAGSWLKTMQGDETGKLVEAGTWVMLERGKLPGAANWSHQYGEPGNTAASEDRLVKGGMGVLWYGDPGPGEMVNRHDGAVGPVSANGRLFVQGQESVMAYDAYNGQFLWEVQEKEAIRTGVFQNQNPGNLVASDDSLFVMIRGKCVEFDAATGAIKATYGLPESSGDATHEWGFLAYQDGILFGTATTRKSLEAKLRRRGRVTDDATDAIFAFDTKTKKLMWSYGGKNIVHHTIAIGPERVFFIDSSITSEQRDELLRQDKTELKQLTGKAAKQAEERMKRIDARMAVALNAQTGKKVWEEAVDVTDCSDIGTGGGKLTLMYHNNVLVLCGANANGHYWQQFMSGEFSQRRLVALSAEDGHRLWARDANYRHRPIIVEDRIIAEPWKYDLYTGAQDMRTHPLTGELVPWSIMRSGHHCGMLSASPNMLFFRSGYTGYYDLETDTGTSHFAGHRTGCWINMIPANGLLMIPEASAGCVCLFSIASTIVMEPREERTPWAIYSSVGEQMPVKHVSLNFGAPGDRRDARGTIWLAYPRPKPSRATSLDLALNLAPKFQAGGGYESLNTETAGLEGVEVPWVSSSGARGLTQCTLPLRGKDDKPAAYTVKLHFSQLNENAKPAGFAIKIQGKTMVENAVSGANASQKTFVQQFDDINVTDNLVIELVPNDAKTPADKLPVLAGISVQQSTSATASAAP